MSQAQAAVSAKPARAPRAPRTKKAADAAPVEQVKAGPEAPLEGDAAPMPRSTKAQTRAAKKKAEDAAASTQRVTDMVNDHVEQEKRGPGRRQADKLVDAIAAAPVIGKTDDGHTIVVLADATLASASESVKAAVPIPSTGYQGPMLALRQRLKNGVYQKAANGQPSCGDEVAQVLGQLEPKEVIQACLVAMDLDNNPYLHLNIGQQSMNLRNKLRGIMKRGELGMGVLREAVEVVLEKRPAPVAKAA